MKTRSSRLPGLLLIATLALGLVLAACGGGGESSEDKIAGVIETAATSTDPAVCGETQTLSFMEQSTGAGGKEAEKKCEEEAKSGEGNPESVKVSEVEVEGEKATADAEFKGGNFNEQTLVLALVEEEGEWKLNELTGFVDFKPGPIVKALSEQLEGETSIPAHMTSCIVEGVEALSAEELEKLVIDNESQPIVELAESCK